MSVPLLTSAKTIHSFSFATHIIIYGSRSNWSRISFESSLIYLPTLCDISLACHLQNPMCCHSQRLAKEKYLNKLNKFRSTLSTTVESTVFSTVSTITNALPGNPVTRDFEVFEHVASGGPGNAWKIFESFWYLLLQMYLRWFGNLMTFVNDKTLIALFCRMTNSLWVLPLC